jgi:hypothetical protein
MDVTLAAPGAHRPLSRAPDRPDPGEYDCHNVAVRDGADEPGVDSRSGIVPLDPPSRVDPPRDPLHGHWATGEPDQDQPSDPWTRAVEDQETVAVDERRLHGATTHDSHADTTVHCSNRLFLGSQAWSVNPRVSGYCRKPRPTQRFSAGAIGHDGHRS